MKLHGKVTIVTGAGSGIGRAVAHLFAQEGAHVVIAERNADAGEETAAAIRQAGGAALAVATDVRRADQVRRLIDQTVAIYGRIDILVNNAGIPGPYKPFHELDEADWDTVLDINLKGHFLCARFAVPFMIQGGGGAIVNTSSALAYLALANCSAYCASKAGIIGLTKAMALDLARSNIRVNCVVPGSVDTPLMWEGLTADERRTIEPLAAEAEPIGRIADPVEIARAVLFLACDDSSFITGTPLAVDGGLLSKLAAPH
jgi:NAD(P)-dependent dehydrogenase (short-subunit alcohol dehydrogenase family)